MKEFIKKSFKRELLACFLVVAVLPLVGCCVFMIQLFQMKVARDYQRKDLEQAAAVEAQLTELFEKIDSAVSCLAEDPEIRETLVSGDFGIRSQVYSRLYGATKELRNKAQFDLYSAEGVCLYSTGTGVFHRTLPTYWGILKVAAAHTDELIVRAEQEEEEDGKTILRLARAVMDENESCIGFAAASMREENFETVLSGNYGGQDGICIVNRFMETIYSTGAARREDIGTVLRQRLLEGENPGEINGSRAYLSGIGDTGLTSILLRPAVFTADTLKSMYMVLIFMAAASFLFCSVVAAGMSSHLSRPIQVLNGAMDQLKEGKLETRVHARWTDEFGELAGSFNTMAEKLGDYMERQVQQQKQLNETQIAMMQAQLNPHFLYNTLDTMKWVAKANHIPELATLAAKLAKILRTSISSAQFITLKEEMELVECYAQIQRIRFNGKFCFECRLPKELELILVPKLIVQPIVENAVIHGLADCEEGHILVEVYDGGDKVVIEVTDDGCGISQEVVDRLNSRSRERLKGHLGFYNVDTIIRLHYGPEYGLKVYRMEEGGTKVTIVLPIQAKEGETNVKGISSR